MRGNVFHLLLFKEIRLLKYFLKMHIPNYFTFYWFNLTEKIKPILLKFLFQNKKELYTKFPKCADSMSR